MPEYTFKCPNCNKISKVTRTFDEAGNKLRCNKCKEFMNKIYSIGVKFNGGGFYSNDK